MNLTPRTLLALLTVACVSPTFAQNLVPAGDAPGQPKWFAGGKTSGDPKLVPAQIDGAKEVTQALQLTLTTSTDAKPWDYRLGAPKTAVPIAKGDLIGVSFWARCTPGSQFNVVYQQSSAPYDKTIRQTVSISPTWTPYSYFANAKADYAANESNFEIQMGLTAGTLEITNIKVADLGAATAAEGPAKLAALPVATPPSVATLAGGLAATPPRPVPPAKPRETPAYVMLKLDDLVNVKGRVPDRWKKVGEFIKQRNIHASIGIICNSLEGDSPEYFQWIKDMRATGLVEFWCHGYDHKGWKVDGKDVQEFLGTPLADQKEHLAKCQALAKEKLGFTFDTFGSPFNSMDDNTVQAMAENPDFKIWLYGDPKRPGGKVVLDRVGEVNIENPLFVPSLERFVTGYNKYTQRPFFVCQGHAAQWDDARYDQFVKIVDFCQEQKCILTTPAEYVKLKGLQ